MRTVGWFLGRILGAGFAVTTLLVAGCSSGPEFGEVEGVVQLDGRPLPDVWVCYLPDPEKGTAGEASRGKTGPDGRYRLRYDGDDRPGALVGWHRVLVQDPGLENNRDRPSTIAIRVPLAYDSAGQTPLRHEVKPGAQTIDLDVRSR